MACPRRRITKTEKKRAKTAEGESEMVNADDRGCSDAKEEEEVEE
jgi:hypothetical protein